MMDPFEQAAKRFSKEQSKYNNHRNRGTTTSRQSSQQNQRRQVFISEKAKKEAEYNTQQQQQRIVEKQRQQQYYQKQLQYFMKWEESLGVRELSSNNNVPSPLLASSLQLKATSIYGDGDKIALPPSVLETLTTLSANSNSGNPWYFRVGIRNPNYTSFPASPLLQSYQNLLDDDDDDDDTDTMDIDDETNTREDNNVSSSKMYVDELKYKYLTYTYCTVIEFTQEEGYIGLPKSICDALLLVRNETNTTTISIPTTRTIDPSKVHRIDDEQSNSHDHIVDDDIAENKTPGHIAYNAFDIPDVPIEIQLIQYLPKGKSCTVIPTVDAIQNGFYHLPDIKLTLEQSLVRTRGTLSQNNTISTWYRGKQYNLQISHVVPNTYQAVSCINTDIEIDFGTNPEATPPSETGTTTSPTNSAFAPSSSYPSGGYVLGSGAGSSSSTSGGRILNDIPGMSSMATNKAATSAPDSATTTIPSDSANVLSELLPEPIIDDTNRNFIVKIQFRNGMQTSSIRCFDINKATGHDLFAYAQHFLMQQSSSSNHFQIVSRYPRRLYTKEEYDNANKTLMDMGIKNGQELLFIEYM